MCHGRQGTNPSRRLNHAVSWAVYAALLFQAAPAVMVQTVSLFQYLRLRAQSPRLQQ